jgi:hypothetical protein
MEIIPERIEWEREGEGLATFFSEEFATCGAGRGCEDGERETCEEDAGQCASSLLCSLLNGFIFL